MDICIVGTGYVGLSTALGFAEHGNSVICVDIDRKRVDDINRGRCPVFEPGMEESLKSALKKGLMRATLGLKDAVSASGVIFISVPTPCDDRGRIDARFIDKASRDVAACAGGYKVIAVKSTVIPGTTEAVVKRNFEAAGKELGRDYGLCMNPEFLREGHALEDFLNPDRVVIGSADKKSGEALKSLYEGFNAPILMTDIKTAEMIKYASNSFLAAKITLANEIGNMCKLLGMDVYKVMEGVGLDARIGPKFLRAGCGFGGSCFPKDMQALIAKGDDIGYEAGLLKAVLDANSRQRGLMVGQLKRKVELKGARVAVLGLAFNPDTDDVRESAAIDAVGGLLREGAEVVAYDPKAMENFRKLFPQITYAGSARDALAGADACIITADWDEFRRLEDRDFSAMKSKIIIEGRKTLDASKVSGFEGVCW